VRLPIQIPVLQNLMNDPGSLAGNAHRHNVLPIGNAIERRGDPSRYAVGG